MIIIPGFLIALATFPGVIVHEAAHMFFCKLRRVAVLNMCFFRIGNPAGYIVHEEIGDFTSAFLVSVGPLLINAMLCVVICFPAFRPVRVFHLEHPLSYFLLWLGVSIGMHAFPSTHDATNLYQHAKKAAKNLNPLAILSYPLVVAIIRARAGSAGACLPVVLRPGRKRTSAVCHRLCHCLGVVVTEPLPPAALIAVTSTTVAVGTPVARRPPHGSVREGLPHTALTSGC
jgi:hypothetical protein